MSQIFNASDAILQLAQRIGEGQNFDKRFAQGQALVESVRRHQAQQDALALESERLQLAADAARRGASTPTSARVIRSPFTQSVEQANAEFKAPSVPGLDPETAEILRFAQQSGDKNTVNRILNEALERTRQPIGTPGAGTVSGGDSAFTIDEQGNVRGTQGGRELTQGEIRQRGGFVGPGRQAQVQSPVRAAKQRFLESLPNVSDQAKQALQTLVEDDSIDLNQLAIRANQLRERSDTQTLTQRQQLSFERSLIREQADDVDRRIRGIEQELENEGVNVLGRTPADLLENEFRDNPRAQALFLQLTQLKAEKRKLRSQEQSLIAGAVTQPQQVQTISPTAGESVSELSDEQLRNIAGF